MADLSMFDWEEEEETGNILSEEIPSFVESNFHFENSSSTQSNSLSTSLVTPFISMLTFREYLQKILLSINFENTNSFDTLLDRKFLNAPLEFLTDSWEDKLIKTRKDNLTLHLVLIEQHFIQKLSQLNQSSEQQAIQDLKSLPAWICEIGRSLGTNLAFTLQKSSTDLIFRVNMSVLDLLLKYHSIMSTMDLDEELNQIISLLQCFKYQYLFNHDDRKITEKEIQRFMKLVSTIGENDSIFLIALLKTLESLLKKSIDQLPPGLDIMFQDLLMTLDYWIRKDSTLIIPLAIIAYNIDMKDGKRCFAYLMQMLRQEDPLIYQNTMLSIMDRNLDFDIISVARKYCQLGVRDGDLIKEMINFRFQQDKSIYGMSSYFDAVFVINSIYSNEEAAISLYQKFTELFSHSKWIYRRNSILLLDVLVQKKAIPLFFLKSCLQKIKQSEDKTDVKIEFFEHLGSIIYWLAKHGEEESSASMKEFSHLLLEDYGKLIHGNFEEFEEFLSCYNYILGYSSFYFPALVTVFAKERWGFINNCWKTLLKCDDPHIRNPLILSFSSLLPFLPKEEKVFDDVKDLYRQMLNIDETTYRKFSTEKLQELYRDTISSIFEFLPLCQAVELVQDILYPRYKNSPQWRMRQQLVESLAKILPKYPERSLVNIVVKTAQTDSVAFVRQAALTECALLAEALYGTPDSMIKENAPSLMNLDEFMAEWVSLWNNSDFRSIEICLKFLRFWIPRESKAAEHILTNYLLPLLHEHISNVQVKGTLYAMGCLLEDVLLIHERWYYSEEMENHPEIHSTDEIHCILMQQWRKLIPLLCQKLFSQKDEWKQNGVLLQRLRYQMSQLGSHFVAQNLEMYLPQTSPDNLKSVSSESLASCGTLSSRSSSSTHSAQDVVQIEAIDETVNSQKSKSVTPKQVGQSSLSSTVRLETIDGTNNLTSDLAYPIITLTPTHSR